MRKHVLIQMHEGGRDGEQRGNNKKVRFIACLFAYIPVVQNVFCTIRK